MNCKKGDIAIVVRTHIDNREYLGTIVKCIEHNGMAGGYPSWKTDKDLGGLKVEDAALFPIRLIKDKRIKAIIKTIQGENNA